MSVIYANFVEPDNKRVTNYQRTFVFHKLGPIYDALKIELTRMVNGFYDFFILVFASPRIILAPVALQNK